MEAKEIEIDGRKYMAYVSPDEQSGAFVIIGPPDVADSMGLPEPFATRLHNILFDRRIFSYKDIVAGKNTAVGIMQEALSLDVQKLVEAYFNYGTETVHN